MILFVVKFNTTNKNNNNKTITLCNENFYLTKFGGKILINFA